MKELGDLSGWGIDRALEEEEQFDSFINRQGKEVVDVLQLSFPQQEGGHLVIAGIGLADKAFVQVVLAAGDRMHRRQKLLITAETFDGGLIINYIVGRDDEIGQL